MPSNEVIINGNIKYEVPDSYMGPLEAYLEMVTEKTLNVVFDAQDDGGPGEGQVYGQGAPTILDGVKDPVPVQNDLDDSLHIAMIDESKLVSELTVGELRRALSDPTETTEARATGDPQVPDPLSASESLDLVERCQGKVNSITFKLASVLQDDPSEMNWEKTCPLLDSLENLFDSLARLDNSIRV